MNMGIRSGIPRAIRNGLQLPKLLWITLILQSLFVNLTMQLICGPGIESIGGTFPSGNIVLEYGSGVPLEITCVLDPENIIVQKMILNSNGDSLSEQPSQKIKFYKNFELIPEEYISIINSTAAQLRLVNPTVGNDDYYCALLYDNQKKNHSDDTTTVASEPSALETNVVFPSIGKEPILVGVCLNRVSVGYKPLEITNITCTSYNLDNLTCNWTKPLNPVQTKYKIFFEMANRSGGSIMAKCPNNSDITDNTCYWDISTSPDYRQLDEYYFFTLYGENQLGNSSTTFRFHHFANVIPASPFNITATHTTQSSVMLRWSLGSMAYFPQELIHKIEYGSRRNSVTERHRSIEFVGRPDCNSSSIINQTTSYFQNHSKCDVIFNVTDLKYPFTDYDFHIYVRTSAARGEDKWSAPGSITVKTKPTIPRNPPKIDVGSFESIPSKVDQYKRDVLIYWKEIGDDEKCGDLFHYFAYYTSTTPDNKTIIHRSNQTYKNYAVFKELSISNGYNFTVYSSNNEGLSTAFSTIYVPSESQKLQKPLAVTLMTFNEHGIFEISWENADDWTLSTTNELNYYTLFWCEKLIDHPNQCDGYLNSISVPGFKSRYNITGLNNEKNYLFAISSNGFMENDRNQFISTSSGMARESCRVLYGKSVENFMGLRFGKIGSNYMALKWSFNCTENIGFVKNYYINYCPIDSKFNPICNGAMSTKIIDKNLLQKENCLAIFTHLKPLTTYMFRVSVITNNGKGLIYSETVFKSTLEKDISKINKISATK